MADSSVEEFLKRVLINTIKALKALLHELATSFVGNNMIIGAYLSILSLRYATYIHTPEENDVFKKKATRKYHHYTERLRLYFHMQ